MKKNKEKDESTFDGFTLTIRCKRTETSSTGISILLKSEKGSKLASAAEVIGSLELAKIDVLKKMDK